MRPGRPHKSDSITFLFLLVMLGMLLTSVVQAEDYLFGQYPDALSVHSDNEGLENNFQSRILPSQKHPWLQLSDSGNMKTSFKGGMAHFLYEGSPDHKSENILPENTRLIFSLGIQESSEAEISTYSSDAEWQQRYKPTLYFTFGHRW